MWRHINIPKHVYRELSEIARWTDVPKGAGWVDLRVLEPDCFHFVGMPRCWLPWNKNRRPISQS